MDSQGKHLQIDLDYLKQTYASLSDEALDEVDRDELIPAAQKILDQERSSRNRTTRPLPNVRLEPEPDWLTDAICAASFLAQQGRYDNEQTTQAREALETAGIPVYVGLHEDPGSVPEMRVMVPSRYTFEAESVLDREIYNPQIEENWKNHFSTLSGDEFRELDFEMLLSGLTDRLDRLRRVYQSELAARSGEP